MKSAIYILIIVMLFSCTTYNETKAGSQILNIEKDLTITLGTIKAADNNNIALDDKHITNLITIISTQTDLPLSYANNANYKLNIELKESSYIKKLETENSIIANFFLLDTETEQIVYRGLLLQNSKTPISSDHLLYTVLNKSYSLLVETLAIEIEEYLLSLAVPEDITAEDITAEDITAEDITAEDMISEILKSDSIELIEPETDA